MGGRPIDIQRVPHQASLRYRAQHLCGASIISARHCLTAAHCYQKRTAAGQYSVLVGSNLRTGGPNHVVVTVQRFTQHENYHARTNRNDIAVLTLQRDLGLNARTIVAIRLPAQDANLPSGGTLGIVSGWWVDSFIQYSIINRFIDFVYMAVGTGAPPKKGTTIQYRKHCCLSKNRFRRTVSVGERTGVHSTPGKCFVQGI